ncbi:membrane protein [Xanthomonas sp. MUS 060]|uniref:membrane protein n=1 Tax=Xanthomonas sp. MUS 060 TaxID=1588031 RepID=UPI0005F27E3B|nr:membrane protein [Xanthomonas sp. MUS 060]
MSPGTKLMMRLYLPPALLALVGFLIAEVLLHFATGRHATLLARSASLVSLCALLGATVWALWGSWRAWHRQRYVVDPIPAAPGEEMP